MAAGTLASPGTPFGPCANTAGRAVNDDGSVVCTHTDCLATITMAHAACALCSQPINYDTRFYDRPLRHARCEEEWRNP
mgnify:CR=1 FL=1